MMANEWEPAADRASGVMSLMDGIPSSHVNDLMRRSDYPFFVPVRKDGVVSPLHRRRASADSCRTARIRGTPMQRVAMHPVA
jgi:hypothetical protein